MRAKGPLIVLAIARRCGAMLGTTALSVSASLALCRLNRGDKPSMMVGFAGPSISRSIFSLAIPSPVGRNVLRLQIFHQTFMRAFAPDAALLHAAEGRRRIGDNAAVEPDHAAFEPLGDTHAAAKIAGIEIGDKPVDGIICAADSIVLRREALDRGDRAEDLLLQHHGALRHVR